MLSILVSFILLLLPEHDFHTSWMNLTYQNDSKKFEIFWQTDTEHLEGVVSAFSKQDVTLNEGSVDSLRSILQSYLDEHTELRFNSKSQDLIIEIVETTFAETTIHFKAIKCKKKLKEISMYNSVLISQFPNQKNMVQINYGSEMNSMLFDQKHLFAKINME